MISEISGQKTSKKPIKNIINETIRSRKKQIPSNLRSDAEVDAGKNGQPNGNFEREGENKPSNKENAGELGAGNEGVAKQ
jgi:hypothetical protein